MPVGLKTDDGKIYLLIGEHKPLNSELAHYAAKNIAVEGKVTSRDGLDMIENAVIQNYNFDLSHFWGQANPTVELASLYYSAGGKYQIADDVCQFAECHASERAIVIASERLNEKPSDWIRVAPNHVLTVTPELAVNVELMNVMRLGSTHA